MGIVAIQRRVHDPELGLNESPGGTLYEEARKLTSGEIGGLIEGFEQNLLDLKRNPSGHLGQDSIMRWRYNRTIAMLKDIAALKASQRKASEASAQAEAGEASGKEACTCGKRHPYGANFYVSVIDAGRTQLLAGPYRTHAKAVADVEKVKKIAHGVDTKSAFYSFGTVAMKRGHKKPGLFNKEGLL